MANGDGPVLGREFEIAEILRFIKREDIRNIFWLTATVFTKRLEAKESRDGRWD